MSDIAAWMRERFSADKSKRMAHLADRLGLHRSAVSRMLAGARQIKVQEIPTIAEFFGERPPIGFAEEGIEFRGAQRLAPVRRASVAAEGWLLHLDEPPIDHRPRSPHFANAASVFGFYAPDDIAAPRYRAGEMIFVDPERPLRPGDDAVFVDQSGRSPRRADIGVLRMRTRTELVFADYQGRERRLPGRRWRGMLVVPR